MAAHHLHAQAARDVDESGNQETAPRVRREPSQKTERDRQEPQHKQRARDHPRKIEESFRVQGVADGMKQLFV